MAVRIVIKGSGTGVEKEGRGEKRALGAALEGMYEVNEGTQSGFL